MEDHVKRVEHQWSKEMPEVSLRGMCILARARRITLAARPQIEAIFSKHGLDTGQFDVLATLRRSGAPFSLRPTELFQTLMITSSGLTDRLHRLTKLGYVSRQADPNDKRSSLVQLTYEGRAVIEAAFAEDMALENQIVDALTEKEQKQLVALLAKLARSIELEDVELDGSELESAELEDVKLESAELFSQL
ncbi:MarR family winged helix-turn-helix transcriptional regulator [Shewanella salipaludis]|uniref:MarR family transcriptional regulator n=1 Tax=Shewanella salipaludis TaxID=2723052 RepID=A0A972JMH0_9GAMM|nr:MarR family transcriptional regulator [Shewanella salipaludis]NMH66502.1 MarR family transcriptional regulator [Shewanella salipaludis]